MYRRLPLGPHGMAREEVARNQRARIYGAMIEAVAKHGYRATTVAELVKLAGVSRRAFYEQFANKEECFLSTYDILMARASKLAQEAWANEHGWANRVHAALKTVLDDCVSSPKESHVMLVDSLGAGSGIRDRMRLAAAAQEQMIATAFELAPDGVPLPPLVPRAIVGGVRQVVFTRLRDGRAEELLNMTDELLDWVSAYRSPLGGRLDALVPSEPQKIAPARAAFLARDDMRARALDSVVRLTLAGGYADLTDPQIAELAGTSTEAFHKQFRSKQECFLAVLDELGAEAAQTLRDCVGSASCWSEAVRLAVGAFTEFFVARPELLRLTFVELFEVGPAIVDRLTSTIECFTRMLEETGPVPVRAPTIASEAITGAIWSILAGCADSRHLRYLPCLADHITFIVLAPYVGAKQAMQTIEAGRREDRKKAA
jgi:AcrR family transcriptional regulator